MVDSLKQKTIKGVSWSFVEQILTRGVNFVIGIILARLLSPTDYGLVGMMGIFIAISQIFIDGGLTNALIREKDAREEDYSTVFFFNLILGVLFYFLLFFTAPVIAHFYVQPLLKPLLRVMSLILVIGSLGSVQGTMLTKKVDFRTKFIISILASLLSGALGIFCAMKGLGPWALIAQTLTATFVFTLLTIVFVRWMPHFRFSMASFKRLFSYSSKLLAASLINALYSHGYPLVIGKRFTAEDVGLFTRAQQFPTVANETMISTFNRVAYPVFSQIQDDDQRLYHVYDKYIQVFCFFTFPVLLGLCGCARPVVSLLLTDKWLDCVPMMRIMCISLLPIGLVRINTNILYVKGRSDLALRMEIIKKSIMFAIMFISMFFGLMAMCYGLIINTLIDLYFSSYYSGKILGFSLTRQLKNTFPYLLISLFILGEALLFSHYIPNNLLSILTSLIVCPVTYYLLCRALKVYAYNEAIDSFRTLRKRQANY